MEEVRIRIYVMNISCLTDEKEYERAYRLSSTARKKKADALKNAPDKARCIGAGLLIREAFFRFCKETESRSPAVVTPLVYEQIEMGQGKEQGETGRWVLPEEKADEHGRVYLAGEGGSLSAAVRVTIPYLSISHAGDYAAVAMADRRIGVDLERNRKMSKGLARRILSDAEKREWEQIRGSQEQMGQRFLLKVWTEKEAAAKLDGRGIFAMMGELSADDWRDKLCLDSRELEGDYILSWAVNRELRL